jgi:hypothetical protein
MTKRHNSPGRNPNRHIEPTGQGDAHHRAGRGSPLGGRVECELVPRRPELANLIWRIPGSGRRPSLILSGTPDVVPVDPGE